MRRRGVALVVLASALLASGVHAQIASWDASPDSGARPVSSHLALFGALGIPNGAFARTDLSADAGYATRGVGFGIEYTDRFRHGLENGALLLVARNPLDVGAFTANLRAFLRPLIGASADSLRFSATGWTSVWGLAKFGAAPAVGWHLRPFVAVYGGGVYARSPRVEVVATPSRSCGAARPRRRGSDWPGAPAPASAVASA